MTPTMVPAEIPGLLPREGLSATQRQEMFDLLSEHFEGVTPAQFEKDLAEKNWVIEMRHAGRLLGFTTLLFSETHFEGREIAAVYSGDTIVAPQAWRSTTLSRTWIAAVNCLRDRTPGRPCHWLLLTSGFRTYRFLPVFWREFWPCARAPIPPGRQRLLNFLAEARYGERYDRSSGIVRFADPQRLRADRHPIPTGREADPDVAYFLARNPGHSRGDELACLTEIKTGNLTPAGVRMLPTPAR